MGERKDEFWDYVETENDHLKCVFCGFVFLGKTSISRIKAHLSGVGLEICGKAPKNVKAAAFEAIQSVNKRLKTMPSSSGNELRNVVPTFSPKITNVAENKVRGVEQRTSGAKLTTTELVGQAFKTKHDEIWSLLMKDEVTSIGVWGMGGVGKTMLMRNIVIRLLESKDIFSHIYWVTVGRIFKIDELQDRINKGIGFDLSIEADELKRQKFVLILDDLGITFDVKKSGVPIGVNGSKMIFTTRSFDICQRMCVCNENIIKVEPLSEKEAWTMFAVELGAYNTELQPLAKAVARECAGLPLGLKIMARCMRGVDDMCEWWNALEEFREAEKRAEDMEPNVFRVLRYSYDRLNDLEMQKCLLYCSFFPKGFEIQREELIEYLIVEGIIEGKNRYLKYDKGHIILNKLENACFLESCIDGEANRCVKMHDLIRVMAIQKSREMSTIMIEAGAQLRKLPDVDEWTEGLVRVSLMENYIREIPSFHSPRCPNLSTLLLRSNRELMSIEDSFFKQLYRLKVLDLSETGIQSLPTSIFELVSLVALLLSHCLNLTYIPSLKKLKELQKLDLSFTRLKKLPEGLELLSNLRYLNIWGSHVTEITTGVLPNLSYLQVLILNKFDLFVDVKMVTGKEVGCLRKLERLECHFEGLFDLRECMEHLSLCTYNIVIGQESFRHRYIDIKGIVNHKYSKLKHQVHLFQCCIITEQDFKGFPKDIEVLTMWDCSLPRNFFGDSSPATGIRCIIALKVICLKSCDGIESLVSLPCPSSNILKRLEILWLENLVNFHTVINSLPSSQSVGLFSCLKHFKICHCNKVKRLFPFGLLSTLQNLEILSVVDCGRMEEIQAAEEEDDDDEEEEKDDDDDDDDGEEKDYNDDEEEEEKDVEFIRLPKLKNLELRYLRKLKRICSGLMICDSLEEIVFVGCDELKRIPLSYPLPSVQRITARPKEWWESVEWDQLSDKNLLLPVFFEYL